MKDKLILTVSQLSGILEDLIEEAFREVYVEGEISNLKYYSSGHVYFLLKDEKAQIKCVMFHEFVTKLKFKLENGLKIIAYCRVDYYPVRGEVSLVVYDVTPKEIGALQLAFEQLKKKLEQEGLFDPARKKKIPLLPQYIGVVTSPDGAAIRDILTVIRRRFANVEVILYPVKVQGDTAKYEIAEGIKFLNEHFPHLDVLLVGRGGGSVEDLWAFNEEIVARAIASSKIPVISCVGHEIDYTIADYVADLRAPTPSAAAEIVVKSKEELKHKIESFKIRLTQNISQLLRFYNDKLKRITKSRVFLMPNYIYENKIKEVIEFEKSLVSKIKHFLEIKFHKLALLKEKLQLLAPDNVLSRGYAIVWLGDKIVKNVECLNVGDEVTVQLYKGKFVSKIKKLLKQGVK